MASKKDAIIAIVALVATAGVAYYLFVMKPKSGSGSSGSGSGSGSGSTSGSGSSAGASASVSLTSLTDQYPRDVAFFNGSPGKYLGNGKWSGNLLGIGEIVSGGTYSVPLSSVPSSGLYVAVSAPTSDAWSGTITINGQVFTVSDVGYAGVSLT